MSSVNSAVETINAAAYAIASAESRVLQYSAPKRGWRGWWSVYWCFGSHKPSKRISHGVFALDPPGACLQSAAHPFIAPPSSPSSLIQSEPLSPASFSTTIHASKFAIGPYAHETQLVTPPLFSGFNTEPSTAPFTPPPESVLTPTTPKVPEVAFAELLTSSLERARGCHGDFSANRASDVLAASVAGGDQRISFELSRSVTLKDGFLDGERSVKRHRLGSKDFYFDGFNEACPTVVSSNWGFFHLKPEVI